MRIIYQSWEEKQKNPLLCVKFAFSIRKNTKKQHKKVYRSHDDEEGAAKRKAWKPRLQFDALQENKLGKQLLHAFSQEEPTPHLNNESLQKATGMESLHSRIDSLLTSISMLTLQQKKQQFKHKLSQVFPPALPPPVHNLPKEKVSGFSPAFLIKFASMRELTGNNCDLILIILLQEGGTKSERNIYARRPKRRPQRKEEERKKGK